MQLLMGYLITIANLQSFQDGGYLRDLSIRVSKVHALSEEIKADPHFDLENFRDNPYHRVGNVGKFLSSKLIDYIYNRNVAPDEEAVILTFYFTDKDLAQTKTAMVPYFIDKDTSKVDNVKYGYLNNYRYSLNGPKKS